jgi:hypothetical protein
MPPTLVGLNRPGFTLLGCPGGLEHGVRLYQKVVLLHQAQDALFVYLQPVDIFQVGPNLAVTPEGMGCFKGFDVRYHRGITLQYHC